MMVVPAFSAVARCRRTHGRQLEMRRKGWLRSSHELLHGRVVPGSARCRRMLSPDLAIEFDGHAYQLLLKGLLKRAWMLLDDHCHRLLELQPRAVFRRGSFLSVAGWRIDEDLLIFAYYLMCRRHQEAVAVAASAGGAS